MSRKKMIAVLTALALAASSGGAWMAGAEAYAKEPEVLSEDAQQSGEQEEVKESEETSADSEDQGMTSEEELTETPAESKEESEDPAKEPERSDNENPVQEECRQPDISQKKAFYNYDKIRVAVGAEVQVDLPYWISGNCSYAVVDETIAKVDMTGRLTGIAVGETILKVTEEDGELTEIPIQVVDVTISKTTYNIYVNDNMGSWYYPSVRVDVTGMSEESVFNCESTNDIWAYAHKTEGYLEVSARESGTITVTIDGKIFTITINIVKAELYADNRISKNLGSIVTYKGKKDTLILTIDGKKTQPKSWESLDKSIATVNSSGQVTGKGLGRTSIRVFLDDVTYADYLVECTYKGAYQAVSNGFHDYEEGDGKGYKIIKYSQPKRMNKGFRDCSSFVYRCYYDRSLGRKIFDIGATGGSWAANAAAQARWLKSQKKTVANKLVGVDKLLPGDTMYTQGEGGVGQWRKIHHAFMYVGNGYVLTTYNSDGKGKTLALVPYNYDGYNVVYIGRPLASDMKTKSISLNKKSITIGVKEKYTLKASRKPDDSTQAVKWSSSKKSVVTVSSKGVLTAKKKGTAYITVKSGSCSAKCKVVVKSAPKKIKLNKKKKTLSVKGTFQIKYTLSKGSGSGKIKYTSSDSRVAAVSSKGKITAKKKGNAVITATTYNGKKATIKVKVK